MAKYDGGDDSLSYAIFVAKEIKGCRPPILYGEAKPIFTCMDRMEATATQDRMNNEAYFENSKGTIEDNRP